MIPHMDADQEREGALMPRPVLYLAADNPHVPSRDDKRADDEIGLLLDLLLVKCGVKTLIDHRTGKPYVRPGSAPPRKYADLRLITVKAVEGGAAD